MGKHAYLIIAHNNFYILKKLIALIDDERNDIYIHIDKKTKNFKKNDFMNICKKSNVYFIKRISVYWGDYSQVQCELNLLKAAIKGSYQYYHLISGVDLPIKSQDYIHNFFDLNENIQYVRFAEKWDNSRVNKIHILNKLNRSNNLLLIRIKNLFNLPFNYLYGKGYDYTQKFNYTIEKGDNWFSITDSAAKYIVSQERIIKKIFKYSLCPDEHFIHTILFNSKFKKYLSYNTCLREIDWKRGEPYTYRKADYNLLINSSNIFARKFDISVDKKIIDDIYLYVKSIQSKSM